MRKRVEVIQERIVVAVNRLGAVMEFAGGPVGDADLPNPLAVGEGGPMQIAQVADAVRLNHDIAFLEILELVGAADKKRVTPRSHVGDRESPPAVGARPEFVPLGAHRPIDALLPLFLRSKYHPRAVGARIPSVLQDDSSRSGTTMLRICVIMQPGQWPLASLLGGLLFRIGPHGAGRIAVVHINQDRAETFGP